MVVKQTVQFDEFPILKEMVDRRRTELRALLDAKQNPLANALAQDLERFYGNTDAAHTMLNQLEVAFNNGVRVRISLAERTRLLELSDTLKAEAFAISDRGRDLLPKVLGRSVSSKNAVDHDIVNPVMNPVTVITTAVEDIASGLKSKERQGSR